MKLVFTTLVLTIAFSANAKAAPNVKCLANAAFLTVTDTKRSDFAEGTIELTKKTHDALVGTTRFELGHDIYISARAVLSPKGSVKTKGADWLIVHSQLIRQEKNGRLTVLATTTDDSDSSGVDFHLPTTATELHNPEVETAVINSGSKILDLVRSGLLADNSPWYANLTCSLYAK